jgi:hypothetical protein
MTPTVIDVAVTPGAAEPPPDAAVVLDAVVVVVVVAVVVLDEQAANTSPAAAAAAIGASHFPRCIPINTLPCVRPIVPGWKPDSPCVRSVDGNFLRRGL